MTDLPRTPRIPPDELKRRLRHAELICPRGRYTHARGVTYQVTGYALDKNTVDAVVIYEADGVVWTRPAEDFKRRFTRI